MARRSSGAPGGLPAKWINHLRVTFREPRRNAIRSRSGGDLERCHVKRSEQQGASQYSGKPLGLPSSVQRRRDRGDEMREAGDISANAQNRVGLGGRQHNCSLGKKFRVELFVGHRRALLTQGWSIAAVIALPLPRGTETRTWSLPSAGSGLASIRSRCAATSAFNAEPQTPKLMRRDIAFVKASGVNLPTLDRLDPASLTGRSMQNHWRFCRSIWSDVSLTPPRRLR